jgi:pyrophosphatase PpaX
MEITHQIVAGCLHTFQAGPTIQVMYKNIFFDFDGTLAPSLEFWLKAYQRSLSHYQITLSDEGVVANCFYRPYSEITRNFGIECKIEFAEIMDRYLTEMYMEVSLFPSVRENLESLKAGGLKLALVTSSYSRIIDPALAKLGLTSTFDEVVTADHVKKHKPDPEPLELALRNLGARAEETIMIGDAIVDVQAGRALGMKTALFLPKHHERYYCFDKLRSSDPHHVFSCHSELLSLLSPQE